MEGEGSRARIRRLLAALADGLDALDAIQAEGADVLTNVGEKVRQAKRPGDAVRALASVVEDEQILRSAERVGPKVLAFLDHVDEEGTD